LVSLVLVLLLGVRALPQVSSGYASVTTSEKGWPEPDICGFCTVFPAGKYLNIQSYIAYIYGSGQPYK